MLASSLYYYYYLPPFFENEIIEKKGNASFALRSVVWVSMQAALSTPLSSGKSNLWAFQCNDIRHHIDSDS